MRRASRAEAVTPPPFQLATGDDLSVHRVRTIAPPPETDASRRQRSILSESPESWCSNCADAGGADVTGTVRFFAPGSRRERRNHRQTLRNTGWRRFHQHDARLRLFQRSSARHRYGAVIRQINPYFSTANKVILTALKKYGLILADNGSGIYLSGAPDDRWNNDDLSNLKKLTGADFDVVAMGTVYTAANVPQGSLPVISSFTATSRTVAAGTPVLLTWAVTGSEYNIITPDVGAVRATMTTVTPTKSTTYARG